MSGQGRPQTPPAPDNNPSKPPAPKEVGADAAWTIVSLLVAGPAVWAAIGYGVDSLAGTGQLFTLLGVVLGFVGAFYLVYIRFGRS